MNGSAIVRANRSRRRLTLSGSFGPNWITAERVSAALERLGAGPLLILLDSPGGFVFEVFEVIDLLRDHADIAIHVDRAASSGAVLMVASFRSSCSPGATFYLHRCHSADDDGSDLWDQSKRDIDAEMVDVLASKMPCDRFSIQAMLSRGETLTGRQAANLGLVDRITDDPAGWLRTVRGRVAG